MLVFVVTHDLGSSGDEHERNGRQAKVLDGTDEANGCGNAAKNHHLNDGEERGGRGGIRPEQKHKDDVLDQNRHRFTICATRSKIHEINEKRNERKA